MPDPATLRAQARQLRQAATDLRSRTGTLTSRLPQVRSHYPLPDVNLWSGPNADAYAAGLGDAVRDVTGVADDVHDFATACDRRATELERQADELSR